jgi:hypothetical protein
MNPNTNTDGASTSDYTGSKSNGAAPFNKDANSVGDSLPNTVGQAPSSISVESVDDGNRPLNPEGENHIRDGWHGNPGRN